VHQRSNDLRIGACAAAFERSMSACRHLYLLRPGSFKGRTKSYSPKKLLFHVKRIPFEWRVIQMRDSFERSWYLNDVRTVNIDWNI